MKKRILFVIPNFAIGGITSSLRALLSVLDYSKMDVDIFCRQKTGALKDAFTQARILPESIWLSAGIEEGGLFQKLGFSLFKGIRVCLRIFGIDMNRVYGKIGGRQLKTGEYDSVISFHEGLSPIVCYYPAKKRIAWIHSDYSRHRAMIKKDERLQYERYDSIVCVSEFARSVFTEIYPSLITKTKAIHNIIPINDIMGKSQTNEDLDNRFITDYYTMVSVGRLDPVKQFDRIPAIAAEIKRLTDTPFRWFIIGGSRGYGDVGSFMTSIIREEHVEDEVILLGEKKNVYPYVRRANLYVCTSESESFPLAVNEAKALGIPVVSNTFPSVRESLVDGEDGRIVSIDDMPEVIADIMSGNCHFSGSKIDNETPLNQFYELISL